MKSVATTNGAVKVGRKPRPRPLRQINWEWRHPAHGYGVLFISETSGQKTTTDHYFVLPLPADYGLAFELTKLVAGKGAEARYAVNLGGEGEPASCECKGFLSHGHCRHVEGLQALRNAGRL
jgi:hypothetical protein